MRLLTGTEPYQPKYEGRTIPLDALNVLVQPRQTFTGIPELALDIAQKGILNPPTVALFGRQNADRYLVTLNKLWGTRYCLRDLKPVSTDDGEESFYVLLAGERRIRAFRNLWEMGCEECLIRFGSEVSGACFIRHFGSDEIEVRICHNIPPLNALFLQFSENTHERVPAYEEAKAYAQLYKLLKRARRNLSVYWFAKQVGRSPETIRNALRFCELPFSIQEAVERGEIRYGIAIELARLQENGLGKKELIYWMLIAQTEDLKVPEFRGKVDQYLANQAAGQMSLLDEMVGSQREQWERLNFRQVVEPRMVLGLWTLIHYFTRLEQLFADGALGLPDSPFSAKSPLRVLRAVLEKGRKLEPHLHRLLSKGKFGTYQKTIENLEELTSLLSQEESDQGGMIP